MHSNDARKSLMDLSKRSTLAESRPRYLKFRSSNAFIVTVVAIAIFTDVFLFGLIVPVVPRALIDRSGISSEDAQKWISILLAVNGLGVLLSSPIFGHYADRHKSRRGPFVIGLVAQTGATVMYMMGSHPATLVIARFLQGVSASGIWVVGLALIVDTVGKDHSGEFMGYTGMAMTWGLLLGPMVGGVIYDWAGYHAVFALPIALLVLDIGLRCALIEKSVALNWMSPEELGYHASTFRASSYGTLGAASSSGETTPREAEFVQDDQAAAKKAPESTPLLTPKEETKEMSPVKSTLFLLSFGRMIVAFIGTAVSMGFCAAIETTLPLFVTETFHWSASGAGLIFLALYIPTGFGALVGKWVDARGPRIPAVVGCAVSALALIGSGFVTEDSTLHRILLVIFLSGIGFAAATLEVAFMAEVCRVVFIVEEENPGIFGDSGAMAKGYGLFNIAFSAGQLGGPLASGFIKERAGWRVMTLTFAALAIVTLVPVAMWTGGWIGDIKKDKMKRDARAAESTEQDGSV